MSAPCFGPIPECNDNRTAKRRRIEQMIEMAIALLDAVDGDEHLEEIGDLEPSLGWTDEEAAIGSRYSVAVLSHTFLDGEVCHGDEPEQVSEDGECQELYAGVGCPAVDRSHQEAGR